MQAGDGAFGRGVRPGRTWRDRQDGIRRRIRQRSQSIDPIVGSPPLGFAIGIFAGGACALVLLAVALLPATKGTVLAA
jgi:hypothetical protein